MEEENVVRLDLDEPYYFLFIYLFIFKVLKNLQNFNMKKNPGIHMEEEKII